MLTLLALLIAAPPDLTTAAERSKLTRTGRYEEVVTLCRDYPLKYPGKVVCQPFGTTPEGRPMLSLVASDDGVFEPAAAKARVAGRFLIICKVTQMYFVFVSEFSLRLRFWK